MSDRSDGDADADRPADPAAGVDDLSEFTTVATHFYRAEVDRMATWRTRLDQTTNWAVVVMAAILTWAFSSPDNPHYVLLIGMLATSSFLLIEAQRYQEYDAWRSRVRLLQGNLFAEAFHRRGPEQGDWRDRLSSDLRDPALQLPLWRAVAHRLQRVYLPLLTVLLAAWVARVTLFQAGEPWTRSAAIAAVPGPVVLAAVVGGYLVAAGLTAWSISHAGKREFEDDEPTRTRPSR